MAPKVQTLLPVTFAYSLSSEAVAKVINMLTQEDFHGAFQKLLKRYRNALQPEEITSKGTRVSCV